MGGRHGHLALFRAHTPKGEKGGLQCWQWLGQSGMRRGAGIGQGERGQNGASWKHVPIDVLQLINRQNQKENKERKRKTKKVPHHPLEALHCAHHSPTNAPPVEFAGGGMACGTFPQGLPMHHVRDASGTNAVGEGRGGRGSQHSTSGGNTQPVRPPPNPVCPAMSF